MSSVARQTFEAAVNTAHSTKANAIAASLSTLNAAYLAAQANGVGSAAYAAAIAAADAAHLATIFAAEAKRQQDVLTAANALRAADGVGPSGFGSN